MKIAILDLYEGEANEGMRCIRDIVEHFIAQCSFPVSYQVFDVRLKNEIADLNFDAYISSGGPGSPILSQGSKWERSYFSMMDGVIQHNIDNPSQPKHVFLICHSFQIYCRHYEYARVTKRKSTSFGVMPIHKTRDGEDEPLFHHLTDPFFAVDSRDYQILEPDEEKIREEGGHILCIEKERPHILLERAVMAIRFNEFIIGTQFHPEADSDGMHRYFLREDKKKMVIKRYGERKYFHMMQNLNDPDKIKHTYKSILPAFLNKASRAYSPVEA
jgi:homoserine O-succinyltransferase